MTKKKTKVNQTQIKTANNTKKISRTWEWTLRLGETQGSLLNSQLQVGPIEKKIKSPQEMDQDSLAIR